VTKKFSAFEDYRDEPVKVGSDRAFGCTVGTILILIGVAKALTSGAVAPVSFLMLSMGVVLLCLGIVAPPLLSRANNLWLKLGATIAKLVNPIILAVLFLCVVTPMALVMRMMGKRPLRLESDRSAASYWIQRERLEDRRSTMKRQF
jgi:hypothetical protein